MSSTHKLIAKLLLENTTKKNIVIADFGCGDGYLINFLPLGKIKQYVGMDINEHSIKAAKIKYKNDRRFSFSTITAKSTKYFSQRSVFDVVILVGVLQYLSMKEMSELFIQARLALKPGGLLILSCTTDHLLYRLINIYRYLYPHSFINRSKIIHILNKYNFKKVYQAEKGLILAPFFSNVLAFIFDGIDFLFFRKKGSLGPIGIFFRNVAEPFISLEYGLNIDYGYTLFIVRRRD